MKTSDEEEKQLASKQWREGPHVVCDHWSVEKSFQFDAAHALPNHAGKCRRLHGHTWRCTVTLEGEYLQREGSSTGMLADFGDIKKVMQPLLDNYLDHDFLNETTELRHPTSEMLARWIYHTLKEHLPMLKSVRIEETPTCACTYEPKRVTMWDAPRYYSETVIGDVDVK